MKSHDEIEFSFFGLRGRANGRFAIVTLAILAVVALSFLAIYLHR